MKLDDGDLRAIIGKKLKSGQGGGKNCPAPEVILRVFSGETGEEEKSRLVDHIFECRVCLEKFEVLRETFKEMKKTEGTMEGISLSQTGAEEIKKMARAKFKELEAGRRHPEPGGFRWPRAVSMRPRRSLRPLFWAAAILMIIIGASFLFMLRNTAENILRGSGDAEIRLLGPKGAISGFPVRFEWARVPEAREYSVSFLDEELTVVWTSGKTQETEAALPFEILRRARKGGKYYWKVVAFGGSGSIRESQLQPVIIAND